VAHETGHGFGLPDLYDTDGTSEGVGEYSLMGSGNYTSPFSPTRMDAWSLNELGWVTIVPLRNGGTFSFGAAPTSDTAFYLPVGAPTHAASTSCWKIASRYSPTARCFTNHCQVWFNTGSPPPCGGGLLIYHVDSAQIASTGSTG